MRQPENLHKIKVIVLDVDGVLTDGRIGYHADGHEIKFFHVRDGHGLKLAMRAGLKVGILSGRRSAANETRAGELGLNFIYQGCKDKRTAFETMLADQHVTAEEVMYVGDDLVDMPPMRMAGFAVAVADAVPELDAVAHYRTALPGGQGAVREAVEYLLKGQDKWDSVLERYLR